MIGFILVIVFLALVVLDVPIAFSMGLASLVTLYISHLPISQIPSRTVTGIDLFTYLAIPMFILAGALMDTGGIANRLVKLAKVLVGHFRGGLAMVVVVAEMFFSGISGSTVADVSAMSSMMLPSLKKSGYTGQYSISVICAASAMGMLIPPCILMVALAGIANESVGALFLGGLLPAVFLGLLIMLLIYFQALKYNFPAEPRPSFLEVVKSFIDSLIALAMPVIIFGGIMGGIATPTEIAAIAVVYAFIVGVFVYRELKIKDVWRIMIESAVSTASIMVLIGFANIFSYILALGKVPQLLTNFFLSISSSPFVFMVGVTITLIIAGSLLEGVPAALIFTPVFLPVVHRFGIDPLHFLIVMVAAIGVGLFIPPAGIGLVVGARLGNMSMEDIMKSFYPFLIILFVGIVILILVPQISVFIPNLLMPKH
ncbi:TRAP transporter large permease [Neomoorella mulderi]|uniref:Sialic acid TRAP transporter permease protein SiaT n=1 Tax=Moorella mulderi DSM 14980 TaxID=1122241 RepID=A0A151AVU5_9FIRM|nr:TRAP transporter large permease [Moorella mulderi]KYH31789.1 sialic acid TRAP transporter permease protein SiaT [Moorella mulderi DSM 14980]